MNKIYNFKYFIIFIIIKFVLSIIFNFDKYLNAIKLDIIHIRVQTIISKGQWTQRIILEINIEITNIVKINQVFLYQAKNNHDKKAIDTVAWSDGKDASGICSRSNFHTHFIASSGLSICIIFCIIKLIIIQIITQ